MAPPKSRGEQIQRALLRKAFSADCLPKERDTLVDFRECHRIFEEQSEGYRAAQPFPHAVIDDFLPQDSLRAVFDAMPDLDDPSIQWGNLDAALPDGRPAQAQKYHLQNVLSMKPALRQLIFELNSGPFVVLLSRLTGIEDLVVDPLLQGGGVHLVRPGGLLRVHADFRKHPTYHVDRRLNLLLYMNPDWQEEYGGHLELWSSDMSRCEKRLLPLANRCVIFSTSADSFHGHPEPLACPEGMLRKSIALYYYTAPPTAGADEYVHATAWQDLPGEASGRRRE